MIGARSPKNTEPNYDLFPLPLQHHYRLVITMTTVLTAQGKYRPRKEWSTNSIPTLVSLEEESSPEKGTTSSALPPKAPRRSSLAVGLMGGRISGKSSDNPVDAPKPTSSKRRSSIAVAFLGRHSKVYTYLKGWTLCFFLVHSCDDCGINGTIDISSTYL